MPESGEWFSPHTRPEMLTSDDPPIQDDKAAPVRILPGPATPVGRATAPLRRVIGLVPALGRRIIRVGDDPSRLQLIGMWTTGSAIVAATGLAVAAVLGGAPPALTQPFERLAVLPGIVGGPSHQDDAVSSADKAAPDGQAADRQRTSAVSGSDGSSYSAPSYPGGSSAGSRTVVYPEDLIPGRPIVPQAPSGGGGTGQLAPPAGGGTGSTVAPAPGDPTPPPTQDPAPPVDPVPPTDNPTDPATPVDPAPPTDNPTDPAPTDPPPPAEPPSTDTPPAQPPTTDPPAADPPVADPSVADPPTTDPPAAEQPVGTPPAAPAPTPDPGQVTPAP